MIDRLAPVHLALSAVLVLWNILVAGRIAAAREAPRGIAAASALGGLLIAPALLVALATSSVIYGQALDSVTWLWPVAATVIAVQAVLIAWRRVGAVAITLPIAAYDVIITAAGWLRYLDARTDGLPDWSLAVPGAQAAALAPIAGSHALVAPAYLHVPILAPAFRARWRLSLAARAAVAFYALGWALAFAWGGDRARRAVRDYRAYDAEPLRERSAAGFAVGLHILPPITRAPWPIALARDLRLIDTLGVRAVSLTIAPEGARRPTLDSLARVLDPIRRDTVRLLVKLGYAAGPRGSGARADRLGADRLAAVREIARRLRPDVLFPAPEPWGEGERALGNLPLERWTRFITDARAAGRIAAPRMAIGVLATASGARDSALLAWAEAPGSPVDVLGLSVTPSSRGPVGLDARTGAFERWLAAAGGEKPVWVYTAGAPSAHGERNQARALWKGIAWATSLPRASGVIVMEAGDYGAVRGLRRVDGRLRPAAGAVIRAVRALRETAR